MTCRGFGRSRGRRQASPTDGPARQLVEHVTITSPYAEWRTWSGIEKPSVGTTSHGLMVTIYMSDTAYGHLSALTRKPAAREFYVGEFYCRVSSYNASILRLKHFLHTYPAVKARDKALYYLVQDYRELHNAEKAQYYVDKLTVSKNIPRASIYDDTINEASQSCIPGLRSRNFTAPGDVRRHLSLTVTTFLLWQIHEEIA